MDAMRLGEQCNTLQCILEGAQCASHSNRDHGEGKLYQNHCTGFDILCPAASAFSGNAAEGEGGGAKISDMYSYAISNM